MKNRDANDSLSSNRQPAVAGTFYPSDPQKLFQTLEDAFRKAVPNKASGHVVAIIAPHAGYVYSAKVAASAFNQIDTTRTYEHVFILGSSHRMAIDGASIYTAGDFMTPLGSVKTDALAKELVRNFSVFNDDTRPHLQEHCIEVELPFLQYLFKEKLSIIPILLGTHSPDDCAAIALALKPYFNEKNLFVISTDFTHYPDYATATRVDAQMADAIISNTPANLIRAVGDIENRNDPALLTGMCGWTSVLTLLDISSTLPGITIRKVDYQNSGDVEHGDKSRVVGYVALSVEMPKRDSAAIPFSLTADEKNTLLAFARNTIREYVRDKGKYPSPPNLTANLKSPCGAFVSLHESGVLRGCIGSFRAEKPLYQTVQDMAIEAAVHDHRFEAVTSVEVASLQIEISVLTPMHKITSIDEIVLGKHGIYLRKGNHTGTFLPQVASDQNWTLEEFLGFCARDKAGIGWDGWKDAEIFVYEAIVFSESHP